MERRCFRHCKPAALAAFSGASMQARSAAIPSARAFAPGAQNALAGHDLGAGDHRFEGYVPETGAAALRLEGMHGFFGMAAMGGRLLQQSQAQFEPVIGSERIAEQGRQEKRFFAKLANDIDLCGHERFTLVRGRRRMRPSKPRGTFGALRQIIHKDVTSSALLS